MAGSGFTIDVRNFSAAVRRLSSRELAETASLAAADIIKGRAEGAFRHPELRPAPWPPLATRTATAVGMRTKAAQAAKKKEAAARAKAKKWREKANDAKTEKARAKALENLAKWESKGRDASAAKKTAVEKGAAKHSLLIDTGNLMGSFSVVSSGKGWKITSSVDYAPYHQFGTSKMPARPMLPFDDQGNLLDAAKEDVETAMMQGVAKMAKELGFRVKGMK
ncbi:MAG: hypothetical protein IKH04_09230 [Kiritimatiellae bacterium]|nr:hypothetical protein [Kiritimatiellia bacterium]